MPAGRGEVADLSGDPQPAPRRRPRLLVAGVALGAVAVDALAKVWAVSALSGRGVRVLGDLVVFRLSRNPGGAFGSFQGAGTVLAVVAVLAVVWVIWYAGSVHETLLLVGLGLVAGGALGNLVDRVFRAPGFLRGHVVDFIDLPRWPTFNVADMCVSAGVVLVVVFLWRDDASRRSTGGRRGGGSPPARGAPPGAEPSTQRGGGSPPARGAPREGCKQADGAARGVGGPHGHAEQRQLRSHVTEQRQLRSHVTEQRT